MKKQATRSLDGQHMVYLPKLQLPDSHTSISLQLPLFQFSSHKKYYKVKPMLNPHTPANATTHANTPRLVNVSSSTNQSSLSLFPINATFPLSLSSISMELPVSGDDGRRITYTIETKNLSCTHKTPHNWLFRSPKVSPRFIIKNVNFEAKPGEITAIAGPSGAGKTTLLEILAGKVRRAEVSGEVLVNGRPMKAESFHRLSGYVTQDDALFPLLSVEETLTYSALLRLPDGKSVAYRRVKALMKELGLDHIAASRVGGGSMNGISGGERRRLSIGVELIHDPIVLLIDEPTSGLDSSSALHIVSLLRSMAVNQAKTVILTIHQPGFRILDLLHRLVLLSDGRVLHHGSLQLLQQRLKNGGHRIPTHINVLEFAIEITDMIGIQTQESSRDRERQGRQQHNDRVRTRRPSYANSRFQEVLILSERFSKNIFRTKELFTTRVLQALIVGSILGTVYINVRKDQGKVIRQTQLGFFAFTLSFLLSSTTEGLPIFLQERRIFMRETLRGAYRVSSYVIANTIVFFPFLLTVGILYSTPAYWLVGLRRDIDGFLYFTLVVWMVVLMSNSFTAFCSALVPNFIMGASVIAGLMGSFFLFSGYFISQENIPDYWIFMHYLSLFKYPFESLMINEYGGKGGSKCLEKGGGGECVMYGNDYLREQGLKESQRWSNLVIMFAFIFGYRVLCFFILWFTSYTNRK